MFSTDAMPKDFLYVLIETISIRSRSVRKIIPTSLIHLEYTMHMRNVDVIDQLRASYSIQN